MTPPRLTRESPRFQIYCRELAAFVWSGLAHQGISKEQLWDRLGERNRELIENFVLAPKDRIETP